MAKIQLPETMWLANDVEALPQQLGEKLIDCYIDKLKTYRKRPGIEEFVTIGTDPIEGVFFWAEKDAVFVASAGNTYKVTRDGTVTDITAITMTDNGRRVVFDSDGTYIVMGNGGALIGSTGATTQALTDGDEPATSTHPVYLDSYCIANVPSDDKWQFSEAGAVWSAALAWDALDFYNAQTKSDTIQAVHVIDRRIYLVGETSTEVWFNDGVSPFSRIDSLTVDTGTSAPYSCVQDDENLYMLDTKRRVVVVKGEGVQILSEPVDSTLHGLAHPQDARAFLMTYNGIKFYVITFLIHDVTYALDVDTGRWYQWGLWDADTGTHGKLRGHEYVYAHEWGKHILGGTDGKLYMMSDDAFTDSGTEIHTIIRTAPIIHGSYEIKKSKKIEFRVKRGLGPTDTENEFEVRWNTDNKGWGIFRQLSLGTSSDKEMFVRLAPMGRYKSRQYEIRHSANTDFQLMSVEEDVGKTGEGRR